MGKEMEDKETEEKEKSKKSRLLTILALIFAIIGILLLLYPVVYDRLREGERLEAVQYYQKNVDALEADRLKEMLAKARQYNEALFSIQETGRYVDHPSYEEIGALGDSNGTLGYLSIPAIGIESMPIFHGVAPATLDRGLGHIPKTSIPIGGENTHAFITGHTGLENQVLFTNLNKLKLGDYFYIAILGESLKYKVDERKIVEPTAVEELKIQPGRDIVTLQTCTPIDINSHRLLITGHRVPGDEKGNQKEIANTKRHAFLTYEQMAYLGILLFLLLLLLIYVVAKIRQKLRERREKEHEKE